MNGPLVQNLCKTLESAFRHGLIRDSRDCSDFFDVVLILYNQQNTFGSEFWKKKQMGWTHQTITINSTSGIHEDSGKPKTLKKSVGGDRE